MDPVHVEAVETGRAALAKVGSTGKLRDQARKGCCRIVGAIGGGILLLVIAILKSMLPS
jgi:hypothetical protein